MNHENRKPAFGFSWCAAALVVLLAVPARAACDGPTDADGNFTGPATCSAATLNEAAANAAQTRHDLAVALAGNRELERNLRAALEREAALEQQPLPWAWVVGAAGAGVVLGVVLMAVVLH